MKEIKNFTTKPISEFTDTDTLYMQKLVNGFMYTFFISFIKFEKSMVTGKIIDIQPNNITCVYIKDVRYSIGDEISGRISKCYTYDVIENGGCHWFQKNDKDWSCVD